jgi:opacity protein-like surface antigen
MKMKSNCLCSQLTLTIILFAGHATAQTLTASAPPAPGIDDNFRTGWHEVQLGGAVYFSNIFRNYNRPKVDYATGFAQAGYMVTEPGEDAWWRGSFELAPEVFAAGIYRGPGNVIAGGTLWFRYNFVQRDWKLAPYFQLGGGGTYIDLPHYYDGKDFNFNLEAGVGLHYFIRPNLALNAEYRFQHISNANLWAHNIGANADGPVIGISYFF